MAEQVVLVHGLWMHGLALWPLGRLLQRCGFQTRPFSYHSVRDRLADQARQLIAFLSRLPADRLHLVGHSMGGRVILEALKQSTDLRVGRVVLLGVPVMGSEAGRAFGQKSWGRRMMGHSAPLWEDGRRPHAPPGVQVGIIAGELPLGLGRLFTNIAPPHDGVVSVNETALEGSTDSIRLRVNHTGMIFSSHVASQICSFLRHGRFKHH